MRAVCRLQKQLVLRSTARLLNYLTHLACHAILAQASHEYLRREAMMEASDDVFPCSLEPQEVI
jgi:hypothetical protein